MEEKYYYYYVHNKYIDKEINTYCPCLLDFSSGKMESAKVVQSCDTAAIVSSTSSPSGYPVTLTAKGLSTGWDEMNL